MKFSLTHNSATFRVSNATPKVGESVYMDASHVRPDGSLHPLPFLSKGKFLAVDSAGGSHEFREGSYADGIKWPQGGFSVVAQEDSDYWCINPTQGYEVMCQKVEHLGSVGQHVVVIGEQCKVLFTDDCVVNGTNVVRGSVATLSPGGKAITVTKESALYLVLFGVVEVL